MKKWQRYILLLLFLPCSTWGQELMVRDFHLDAEDLSAVKEQVLDHNNKPCALIKVRLPYYQLFFEGDVIYTEHRGDNEYWVYMAPGATWLQIKSPVASPLTYEFNNAVEGLHTYIMQLHLTLSRNYRATPSSTQELRTTSFFEDKNSENDDPQNALIKVRLESFALSFSGDIVEVIPQWNEFWVYMRPSASRLEIRSSIAPPLTYDFDKKLKKGHTYVLQLELKEPVSLPKIKERPEPPKTTSPTTNSYYTTSTKKADDGMKNIIGILYGTASNANSKEYGIRYGQINNNFSGFISEVTLATSIPGYKFGNGDNGDTLIPNSENLHVNAGCIWGYRKIALNLCAGSAICFNGCFGLNIGAGLIGRLGNVLLTFDYELSYYMGDVSDIWADPGHYFKFGIGYVF